MPERLAIAIAVLAFLLPLTAATMDAEALIEALQLEPHVEGGYFRRTFQADHRERIETPAGRSEWDPKAPAPIQDRSATGAAASE